MTKTPKALELIGNDNAKFPYRDISVLENNYMRPCAVAEDGSEQGGGIRREIFDSHGLSITHLSANILQQSKCACLSPGKVG